MHLILMNSKTSFIITIIIIVTSNLFFFSRIGRDFNEIALPVNFPFHGGISTYPQNKGNFFNLRWSPARVGSSNCNPTRIR